MEKAEISFCARFPPAPSKLSTRLNRNIELRAIFHAHFLSRKIFNTERVREKKIIYKKYRKKIYHRLFDGPTLKLNVNSK